MGKPAGFKGVIKPINQGENFVIVPRGFAQDMTISPFAKAVLLEVQSRSENWETNSSTIMHNYKVGRNKARSVLSEGMRAGYVYAHHSRDVRERILPVTYHFSTCRRTLREFVVGKGWETEESYALKFQALGEGEFQAPKSRGLDFRGLEMRHNEKKRIDKRRDDEKEAASGFSHSEPPSFDAFLSARKGGKAAAGEKIQVTGGDADFDAFVTDYKKGAAAASGKQVPAGGKSSAKHSFYRLSPEERVMAREAMQSYFGALKKEGWGRSPQSVSKFLHEGWRDFVPSTADKARAAAKAAADEASNQIRCVAMDINNHRHEFAKRWWPNPEDVPADIREKAVAHAVKEYLYEPSAA